MRLTSLVRGCAAAAGVLISALATAQVPVGTGFSYQGMLRTLSGPADGTHDFQFLLFDAAAAGAQVGPMICADNKAVEDGLFSMHLNFGVVFEGSARWLEIRVRPDTTAGNCLTGSYSILAPRLFISSTPNALFAQAPWATSTAGDVSYTAGSVGIGTSTPSNRLTVANETDNNSIVAIDSGETAAQSSILRFHDRGDPVWSLMKNASNDFTIREVGPGVDRLYMEHDGNVGIGTTNPQAHLHVIGAWSGAAVVVDVTGADNSAVIGNADGSNGYGVVGDADGNAGTGVLGFGPATGYGVYSNGRFAATGTKNFQIDHPLDPAGRYLNHYCTEGPEPLNVYSGNAVLGATGEALVQLPAYFASINRDVRYQLTCIGGYAPVYIAREIEGSQFVIGGGRPGLRVSWRVEATRNDAWVRAYGAPVEEPKPAGKRGTYLNPELYGRPATEGEHARLLRDAP